jgi:predicted nucleotidyltransferase
MGIQRAQIERAIAIAKMYGATRLILFGSALEAPDQARDLDLACDGVQGMWNFTSVRGGIGWTLSALSSTG